MDVNLIEIYKEPNWYDQLGSTLIKSVTIEFNYQVDIYNPRENKLWIKLFEKLKDNIPQKELKSINLHR